MAGGRGPPRRAEGHLEAKAIDPGRQAKQEGSMALNDMALYIGMMYRA